jgi:hypothetical protein
VNGRVLVAAVLVASAALIAVPAAAGANAAAPPGTPSAACSAVADASDDGLRVVGLPAVGDDPMTGTVDLYRESRVEVVLCQGDGAVVPTGDGQVWQLSNGSGYDVVTAQRHAWVVSLTGNATTVALSDRVEGRSVDSGLRIRVRSGVGVDSALVGSTVSFPNATLADRYRRAERVFLAAEREINASAVALNETSDLLTGLDADEADRARDRLDALAAGRERVTERGDELRRTLYAAAVGGYLTPSQSAALRAVEMRQRKAVGQAAGAVDRYRTAVASHAEDTRRDVVNVVAATGGFGLLIGVVVGGGLGHAVTSRRGLALWCLVAAVVAAAGLGLGYSTGLLEVIL